MFSPHKSDTGAVPPWEYIPAAAGTYEAGQLLQVSGGKVAALSAASKTTPPYLCMGNVTVEDGDTIPVSRVTRDMIYETQLSAAAAAATVGTMLEVTAGGKEVDAAAAGTFEVVAIDGTAIGDTVYGRFQ